MRKVSILVASLFFVFGIASSGSASEKKDSNLSRGAKIFKKHCEICHGVKGDGKGPLAEPLGIKPRNLGDTEEMSGADILAALNGGLVVESGMFNFKDVLSAKEKEAVTLYVMSLLGGEENQQTIQLCITCSATIDVPKTSKFVEIEKRGEQGKASQLSVKINGSSVTISVRPESQVSMFERMLKSGKNTTRFDVLVKNKKGGKVLAWFAVRVSPNLEKDKKYLIIPQGEFPPKSLS